MTAKKSTATKAPLVDTETVYAEAPQPLASQGESDAKEADPLGVAEYCEALCDAVHDVSALQARILRATYRDGLDPAAITRATGLPRERNAMELMAAHRTVVAIVTEGALDEWAEAVAMMEGHDDGGELEPE